MQTKITTKKDIIFTTKNHKTKPKRERKTCCLCIIENNYKRFLGTEFSVTASQKKRHIKKFILFSFTRIYDILVFISRILNLFLNNFFFGTFAKLLLTRKLFVLLSNKKIMEFLHTKCHEDSESRSLGIIFWCSHNHDMLSTNVWRKGGSVFIKQNCGAHFSGESFISRKAHQNSFVGLCAVMSVCGTRSTETDSTVTRDPLIPLVGKFSNW